MPKPKLPNVDIEYQKLRQLLAAKKWNQADIQTTNIILKLIGKHKTHKMYIDDIQNLPVEHIRKIDSMWDTFSGNQFGISVQKNIHSKLLGIGKFDDQSWLKFARSIGWMDYQSRDSISRGYFPIHYLSLVKRKKSFAQIFGLVILFTFGLITGTILFALLYMIFMPIIVLIFRKPIMISGCKKLQLPWLEYTKLISN